MWETNDWQFFYFSLLFFDPEYTDEPPEKGEDALKAMELSEETKQKAEESLRNLLELGGDEDDELLLDIDTHLTEKKLEKMPMITGIVTVIISSFGETILTILKIPFRQS